MQETHRKNYQETEPEPEVEALQIDITHAKFRHSRLMKEWEQSSAAVSKANARIHELEKLASAGDSVYLHQRYEIALPPEKESCRNAIETFFRKHVDDFERLATLVFDHHRRQIAGEIMKHKDTLIHLQDGLFRTSNEVAKLSIKILDLERKMARALDGCGQAK
jgi:predicted  nucleic acid-binding Zn-ribbon protein